MADVTFLNLNMLVVRYLDRIEREVHLPLGPLYIVRSLEDAGFAVDFRDYQLSVRGDLFSEEAICDFLKDPADILMVSCMANLLPFALLALKRFKQLHPEVFVVLGGVGPAAIERSLLAIAPWIDAISTGEGERIAPALAAELRAHGRSRLDRVPGLSYRDVNNEIVSTRAPARCERLDEVPFPAWHHLDMSRYAGFNVVTSRGCPFLCTFCSVAPIWGRRPHLRSPDNVVQELADLSGHFGVRLVLFQDEFFVASAERARALSKAIEEARLPIRWKAFGRIDLTDEQTMEAMARAGCIEIRYGVESGSDSILSRTKKGFSAARALEVLSHAVGTFPGVDAFYIWGFPFETDEDFRATLLHMIAARGMGVRILPSLLTLLPQTDIYRELPPDTRLEPCAGLVPEYMLTGHEVCDDGRVAVLDDHRHIYEFIRAYPDLFPGFFHVDPGRTILPRHQLLQRFGFYSDASRDERVGAEVECCGAHSPDRSHDRNKGESVTAFSSRSL